MADWARLERNILRNKVATFVMCLCIFLEVDEVIWALRYHFPWWDDIMMPFTAGAWWASWFVRKHTMMYRIDL